MEQPVGLARVAAGSDVCAHHGDGFMEPRDRLRRRLSGGERGNLASMTLRAWMTSNGLGRHRRIPAAACRRRRSTKQPEPPRTSTRPEISSVTSASRSTGRLTPILRANSRSAGRRSPYLEFAGRDQKADLLGDLFIEALILHRLKRHGDAHI